MPVPLPVHYWRDDDSRMLLELMVQCMGKQAECEKDNKRGPVKNFATDFAKHLSNEFNQTYSAKQVANKMRALKKKWEIVHKRVSSMRHNSDANDVKLETDKFVDYDLGCTLWFSKRAVEASIALERGLPSRRRETDPTRGAVSTGVPAGPPSTSRAGSMATSPSRSAAASRTARSAAAVLDASPTGSLAATPVDSPAELSDPDEPTTQPRRMAAIWGLSDEDDDAPPTGCGADNSDDSPPNLPLQAPATSGVGRGGRSSDRRSPPLSVPHTSTQLVVPAGALKRKRPNTSTGAAVAEGVQQIAAQRESMAKDRESARMVSARATERNMAERLELAKKRLDLEQSRMEEERKDKDQERKSRQEQSLLSMIIDLDRANMPMERFLKQRETLLNAGAGGAALTTGSGVGAPAGAPSGTDEFDCGDTMELDDPYPPPKPTQPLATGDESEDGE